MNFTLILNPKVQYSEKDYEKAIEMLQQSHFKELKAE